ncbi:MAG: TetR/AcrR family transcriptional regulator [Spirochaetales bacterium]|nr:TetR/AcrR family transcriptional regulator [Spirochaetales bacterium]
MAADRRNQIIAAAGECFARYGYDKTSLDDIAAIVGINKVSFYHYFKNKDEIFTAMITEEADKYMSGIIAKAEKHKHCRQRILTWINEGFSYLADNNIMGQLSYESAIGLNPYIRQLVDYAKKKGTAYLAQTLTWFMKRGEIRKINVLRTALIIQDIVYALKEYLHRQTGDADSERDRQKIIIDEIIETVSMILDGITVRSA